MYTRPFFLYSSISYSECTRYFFPLWYSGIGIALCISVYNFFPLIWLLGNWIGLHYLVLFFVTIVVYVYFYDIRVYQGWFCNWLLNKLESHYYYYYYYYWLVTLLRIYLLGNLHLSQTVSGLRLREGKDIHSIPKDQGACPRNLLTIRHVCDNSAVCPTLKTFLVKRVFCWYFRKCLVTTPLAELTKGYI